MSTVNSGSVMVWGCFAALGPGRFAFMEGTMNSVLNQNILKENVRSSVCELKRNWVMQEDDDQNSKASPHLNCRKETKLKFWSSVVKVLT
uniref:Uncharacterized protein n=1 Tax=Anguilla anguilla TaxID=7936 RepID=A0A0E9T2W2_ANGAN